MKKAIFILFFTNVVVYIYSAPYTKRADKLFNKKLYALAAKEYSEYLKKDSSDASLLSKIAECYRLTGDVKGQLACYGKLVKLGIADEQQKIQYARALMMHGDYFSAEQVLAGITDPVARELEKGIKNLQKINRNATAYSITRLPFNTSAGEICAQKFQNKIIYSLAKNKPSWFSVKHGWTNYKYYTTVMTETDKANNYSYPMPFLEDFQSKFNDGPIAISRDSRQMIFTRNHYANKQKASDKSFKLQLFQVTVLSANQVSNPHLLPFCNNEINCAHAAFSPDGKMLFFSSDMPGGFGGMDIWCCKIMDDGQWGTPFNLGSKINTKGNEVFPFLSEEGYLYFSSDSREGLGGLDIYEVRFKDGKPMGKVYNLGSPINSEKDDFGIWFDVDGKSGFFSSNRINGGPDDDIYQFIITGKILRGKNVTFIVKDKDKNTPLQNSMIEINGQKLETNDSGKVQFLLEEEMTYSLGVTKEKYTGVNDSINPVWFNEDEIVKEILLEYKPDFNLVALVTDFKSGQPLSDVKVTIKDAFKNQLVDEAKTSASGEYSKKLEGIKLGERLTYIITLEKDGYLKKELTFAEEMNAEGDIKLHEKLDLRMGKIEVGMDIGKLIDIKPIYFDVGKWDIKPEAARELDKVVKIMKEYPNMSIELGSHTDCRGNAKANLTLSDKRAKSSALYIVKNGGISGSRIKGKGYGESKLLNNCACEGKKQSPCSEEEHAKNRRTEFVITKLK
jgi:outer membrane protein OmpA-like peptidoglycan-associated protein